MKDLYLYALANELNLGDPKSGTIRVPFGRWDFGAKKLDDGRTVFFVQELAKDGAERMAAKINAGVADGEKGVPVYWGHPDVPELAHKYPDKRAKGWIKSAAVEGDALVLHVEWLEENATDGFGWFSPYWGGPATDLGQGRYLKHLDSLTSVALINIPNIQEFRLANELQGGLNDNERTFAMPQHLIELARRYDERMAALANSIDANGMGHSDENGQFDGSGSGNGGGGGSGGSPYGKKLVATRQAAVDAAQKTFDEAKSALIAGQKRGWSKEENDKAFKAYDRAERKLKFAKSELRTAIGAPSISHEEQVRRDSKSVFRGTATKAERDRYMSELARRFDERVRDKK